jgi:hypothetical protein
MVIETFRRSSRSGEMLLGVFFRCQTRGQKKHVIDTLHPPPSISPSCFLFSLCGEEVVLGRRCQTSINISGTDEVTQHEVPVDEMRPSGQSSYHQDGHHCNNDSSALPMQASTTYSIVWTNPFRWTAFQRRCHHS